jgi:IS605 OrfB family transposase
LTLHGAKVPWMLRRRTGRPLTCAPAGPARTPVDGDRSARRARRSETPLAPARRAMSTMHSCFYPSERLRLEAANRSAFGRRTCPTSHVSRRQKRQWESETTADIRLTARSKERRLAAGESLFSVRRMTHNHCLAKSIHDVAWSQFALLLSYTAVWAGRTCVAVNPAYTSQDCSSCGHRRRLSLADRTYACPRCSIILDRELNASRNILRLGQ